MLKDLSQKLLATRKAYNLTQEQLAEKLYVTRQAVSKWERGESFPDLGTLIGLSQLYNTTIDDLLSPQAELKDTQKTVSKIENAEELKKLRNKKLAQKMTVFGIVVFSIYSLICGLIFTSLVDIFEPIWIIWLTFPIVPPIVFMTYFRYEIDKKWHMYFINVPFISLILFSVIANYTDSYGGWLAFLFIPIYYVVAIIVTLSEKKKNN